MNFSKKGMIALAITFLVVCPSLSYATNGYLLHGYGTKAKGMGGVGIALPQDAICSANNPSGMAWVGNRFDIGASWFGQQGTATVLSTSPTDNGSFKGTNKEKWLYPEAGANWMINDKISLGVSAYTLGSIDTKYKRPFTTLFGATGLEFDYQQGIVAPTLGYKVNDKHAIGVSVNVALQRFWASGFQMRIPTSTSPTNVTDNLNDWALGVGFSVGWMGHITPKLDLGATYRSPTWMSPLKKYQGLLANGGKINLPSRVGIGLAYHSTERFVVSLDAETVFWNDAKAFSNATNSNALSGSKNGPGLGWKNQVIVKLGMAYAINSNWTARVGYNYGKTPIRHSDTLANMVTLDTLEHHATAGMTFQWGANELSAFYEHGFMKIINGTSNGTATVNLRMDENTAGLSYGRRF